MTDTLVAEPYGKKNPFPSDVLNVQHLTAKGSPKEAIQIDFNLEGSGLVYESGDALGVLPNNDPALVTELISYMGFDSSVEVPMPDGSVASLEQALIEAYDITALNKAVLTKWATKTSNESFKEMLATGDKTTLDDFCWGRDILDLAMCVPAQFVDATDFVSVLKKLTPRLYSIASSPNAHPGQVQLTVGVVRYESQNRARGGVCSTFMADRLVGKKAKVFIHSNKNFRLPTDKTKPVIMVGPGTGIAPFRSFIEERLVSGATGQNWLFFGNPYRASDFLYEEWLTELVSEGKLKLSLAFSRDQAEKLYVQHLMVQEGKELWAALEAGAYFYICGDASRMAKDVEAALVSVAQSEGGMSEEEALAFVKQLKADKRYQRDVY